jgi:putative SOS response-associated peptidase YedK
MCYSAKIVQLIKDALRRYGVHMDYTEALQLFLRRRADPGIVISKAFEANFDEPANAAEREIKALIDEHRRRMATQWESDLFKQKTRLVAAERKLRQKATKTAQNEVRIATSKIDAFTEKLVGLRRRELVDDDSRIYPMQYAGVIVREAAGYVLTPMRYHCRPQGQPAFIDRKFDGLYCARRDSLDSFWKGQFGGSHAVAVLDAFYENVKLHDLERRELAADEAAKNIILQFKPRPAAELLVACVWSHWIDPQGKDPDLRSFAVVTDDPPPEVAAAGHNRCPINLKRENVGAWLTPRNRSHAELQAILSDRAMPYYEHEVLAA